MAMELDTPKHSIHSACATRESGRLEANPAAKYGQGSYNKKFRFFYLEFYRICLISLTQSSPEKHAYSCSCRCL